MPVVLTLRMEWSLVLAGATSAGVAGLTGSLHCALMCGPLACTSKAAPAAWHVGRVLAYGLVGFLLGTLGRGVSLALTESIAPVLPWVMALGLVATAFELGKRLPPIPGLTRLAKGLARAGDALPPWGRTLALGAVTPLLPCGLLYGMFLAAVATGSPLGGAVVMLAFSLGAIPALVAVQLGATRAGHWPRAALIARRVVPLVAAGVLIVRALTARSGPEQCG
jgi:sulfite exporter TauE/SafE